jgi:hypothetical protein
MMEVEMFSSFDIQLQHRGVGFTVTAPGRLLIRVPSKDCSTFAVELRAIADAIERLSKVTQ